MSPMDPDLAVSSSHSHSPLEGYVPLPPTKSRVHRLPQEDGKIRDTPPIITNSNSSSVSPSSCSSARYIQCLTYHSSGITTSSQSPPCTFNGAVAPSSCSRAAPSVDRTWHSTWTRQEVGIASHPFLTSDFALRLDARSVSRST